MPRAWSFLSLLMAGLLLSASSGLAQPNPGALFERWDRDGDGTLSREELPEGPRQNFERVDRNGDGAVSREEHAAFLNRAGRSPQAAMQRVPESVVAHRDLPYADTDHPRQRLDLYLPKAPASKKLPLVVFIHGGGWQNGDKNGGLRQVLPFVESGEYAGASIGYRLSGDAVWPAQIHDCKAAIRWLRGNAERYGLDPERIGVMGTSAGGHLVALLGTSGGVDAVEGDLGAFDGHSSRVQCVVDFFGPADLLTMGNGRSRIDHNSPDSPESKMLGGPVQEVKERAREASPIQHVTEDDPPFLIIHGDADAVVPFDQSVQLDRALREKSVPSILIRVEGGGHGGLNTPEIDARIRAFLDRELQGREVKVDAGAVEAAR